MAATTHTNKGFTLLQLLFSITIMGLLLTVIITSMNPSRIKGKDSKRLSDLNQMKVALEIYREDNGHYPFACGSGQTYNVVSFDSPLYAPMQLCHTPDGNAATDGIGTLTTVMSPYLSKISDPVAHPPASDRGYLYINNGVTQATTSYCFMLWRTPENLKNYPLSTINPARCGSVDTNGQCATAGTFGAGAMDESVFIGKGKYTDGLGSPLDGC